ncbi:MAG TPA: hypothetical protein VGK00_10855 [Anaerolineales bacterium]|jgi:hypothetical protein
MPVFESSAEDVLGLWAETPQAGAVSFGMGEESLPPEVEVYRVNLPGDPQVARAVFEHTEAVFERMQAALDDVPDRLDGLVQRTQAAGQQQAGGVSFSAPALELEPGPEGELLGMLAEADQGAMGGLSFGLGDLASEAWEQAKAQFKALMAQIDRDVLHFAWVETNISGQLVARTSVDWSGDVQTVWSEGVGPDQASLHERTLNSATLTRHLRLRLFVTVASGAVKVAGLMAAPGGVVLALPAVYQYVTKIVAQARELQALQTT